MIDFTTQLIPLMQKDPIVSTFDSRTLINHPEEVVTSYNRHIITYVETDLLRDLELRFIDMVVRSQTPKACLVARYGYGKTTAAIGLWQACRKSRILAVPPAGYTSIAEIATTVYSWAYTALSGDAEASAKLGELYVTYLQSSAEELARLVSRRSGRPYEQVIEVLKDPALEGALRLDPPTTNIVLFLEALTHIITSNGYVGVAVFVDEFQQLLGKAGADVLTALRSLIWGLRTRKIPFGLAITMDPNSERILGDRAGDILHRIKDDDLYLDFRQIHSSEFPKLLWERYAKQLELNALTFQIVDKPALEALGQICERSDLSNGPRTVANTFRRIASYYAASEKTYTPIQLIDDFITGAIIFDGDTNTIASLVTEFAGYAYFKRSDAHLAVLKLLAAFPGGCQAEIAERYGLSTPFKEITSELRGDIITLLPTGYALIDLQRVGKPLNKLSIILKKYWMQITNTEEEPIESIRRFATYMFPLLFPVGTAQTEAWTPAAPISLSIDSIYSQTFVGRMHARHPLRRIRVSISSKEPPAVKATGDADVNLIIVLCNNMSEGQKAFVRQDKCLVFYIDAARISKEGLPPELRIVEHNLSPQPSTPAALLNVIEFVEQEISFTALKQVEHVQVNHTLENIRRWLLNFIFDEDLLGAIDKEAATPGYRGVRDLLFRECERRFPHYVTLITSHAWRENLAAYRKVLAERTLAERRGIESVKGPKSEIAALFGQRSHAGFESKMKVQYPTLLETTWSGEQGMLQFIPHPLETQISTLMGDDGHPYSDIVVKCRLEGYALEEIEEIVALLVTRGQIKEEGGRIYKVETISTAEIRRIGEELRGELQILGEVIPQDLTEQIETAQLLAKMDTDVDVDRQKAHAQLVTLTEVADTLRKRAYHSFLSRLGSQRDKIAALLRSLDKPIPSFSESVSFKSHLEGVRKVLEENTTTLRGSGVRIQSSIQTLRSEAAILNQSGVSSFLTREVGVLRQREVVLQTLHTKVEQHLFKAELLRKWINWGASFVRLQSSVAYLSMALGDVDSVSAHLAQKLDEIEDTVRERLAQQGISALRGIDEVQQVLEEVTRDYDRNLAEREKAFEQERGELETTLISLTGSSIHLREKYQVSKHSESYKDLYSEALQTVQGIFRSLQTRSRILEVRVQSAEKLKTPGHPLIVDRRMIKKLMRTIVENEEKLLHPQLETSSLRLEWRQGLLEKLVPIKKRLDEMDAQLPTQTMLPIATEAILSKLTPHDQHVSSVIDIEEAIALLPSDSELAVLLQLYVKGRVIINIRVED